MSESENIYEQGLIGGLLFKPTEVRKVVEILQPQDFIEPTLKEIYIAICELDMRGDAVNLDTIAQFIQPSMPNQNTFALVADIAANTKMHTDVVYYAKKIIDACKRRNFITLATQAIERIQAQDTLEDVLEFMSCGINTLYKGVDILHGKELTTLLEEYAYERDEELNGKKPLKIITHFHDLDLILQGFRKGNLVTIAAGSGIGKTTFGLNILKNVALNTKMPVMLLSLEMSGSEVTTSLLASTAKISQTLFKAEDHASCDKSIRLAFALRDDLVKEKIGFKIWTDSCNKFEMAVRVIRNHIKSEPNCKLVMVDYVGLMNISNFKNNKATNRVYEIAEMTRTLKNLAMELGLVILILAQINRNNQDPNLKPLGLNDLRDSSSFAHDANAVIFLHSDLKTNVAQIIVAKNRSGPTGECKLGYDRDKARFYSLTKPEDFL